MGLFKPFGPLQTIVNAHSLSLSDEHLYTALEVCGGYRPDCEQYNQSRTEQQACSQAQAYSTQAKVLTHRTIITLTMASSREIHSLLNSASTLLNSSAPRTSGNTYYYKGATYELDGSAQTAAWAAEGARKQHSRSNEYDLEAIIGEKSENGKTMYLAKWAGYDDSESTYEPAGNFQPEHLAEWQANKARLAEIEMDVDLDDLSLTKSTRGPHLIPTLPTQHVYPEQTAGPTDIEMADSMPESAQVQGSEGQEDDEYAECDDPLGSGVVDTNGDAQRCQASGHPGKNVFTCDSCRGRALTLLTPAQQEAAEYGADVPLCGGCGEAAIEDLENASPCECLTKPQCGTCLLQSLSSLAIVREAQKTEIYAGHCNSCETEVEGDEKVTRCLLCHGLKVRF